MTASNPASRHTTMIDVEKSAPDQDRGLADNPAAEAAAAKLWAVYVSEAEKYDRSLVESWKSDMEGILIFAGLFSASLTAFLIESYKTLVPDSGDTSVFLLTQISKQFAASANGTLFPFPPPPTFTPSTSSLICNALWFISLGLSLTCALVATLLEQWARDFLHKADMRSATVIRARAFSFLYYGLKRFKMHIVVEIIPLLLHASLGFFFAGLVAFLIPVNIIITAIAGAMLTILAIVYSVLTILPLVHLDCPYKTPLSGALWCLPHRLQTRSHRMRPISKPPRTIVESVFLEATQYSPERTERDTNALLWTVKSLADDTELEPFVEAIPDVLWGPAGRLYIYDAPLCRLMKDPDVQLLPRIHNLITNCDSSLLPLPHFRRRQIVCYKALWALATLSTTDESSHPLLPYEIGARDYRNIDSEVLPYAVSANALQQWAGLRASRRLMDETSKHLNLCRADLAANRTPNTTILRSHLRVMESNYLLDFQVRQDSEWETLSRESLLSIIGQFIEQMHGLSLTTPFEVLLDYLTRARLCTSIPYEFTTTQSILAPPRAPLSDGLLVLLRTAVNAIAAPHRNDLLPNESHHWLDDVFESILSYWNPLDDASPPALPWSVVQYLNDRKYEMAKIAAAYALPPGGWKSIPVTISRGPSGYLLSERHAPELMPEPLTAVWMLFYHTRDRFKVPEKWLVLIIDALSRAESPAIAPSVLALAKHALVCLAEQKARAARSPYRVFHDLIAKLKDPLLWAETSLPNGDNGNINEGPDLWETSMQDSDSDSVVFKGSELLEKMHHSAAEARIHILTEFMECCALSSQLPFKAVETIQHIGGLSLVSQLAIHPNCQRRFATAVKTLFDAGDLSDRDELLRAIVNLGGFVPNAYLVERCLDAEARAMLKQTFVSYQEKLSPTNDFELLTRVRKIITQFDKNAGGSKGNQMQMLDLHLATEQALSISQHSVGAFCGRGIAVATYEVRVFLGYSFFFERIDEGDGGKLPQRCLSFFGEVLFAVSPAPASGQRNSKGIIRLDDHPHEKSAERQRPLGKHMTSESASVALGADDELICLTVLGRHPPLRLSIVAKGECQDLGVRVGRWGTPDMSESRTVKKAVVAHGLGDFFLQAAEKFTPMQFGIEMNEGRRGPWWPPPQSHRVNSR
ncbi:hypothetical protein B0H19DRAFT_1065746 [Mycena capillaripes]|nr:hypothetical protein B0H19DRAFT_1065746 [Mycena capillaripes]